MATRTKWTIGTIATLLTLAVVIGGVVFWTGSDRGAYGQRLDDHDRTLGELKAADRAMADDITRIGVKVTEASTTQKHIKETVDRNAQRLDLILQAIYGAPGEPR